MQTIRKLAEVQFGMDEMMTDPNAGMPAGLATDPPVSEKQRKAMYAALHGKSTLGIPKSVAEKFVGEAHDSDDHTRGAGVALRDPDGRLLFTRRQGGDEAGSWAFPGGYAKIGESQEAAAIRELEEELGYILQQPLRVRMADSALGKDNFNYATYVHDVEAKFAPKFMNDEHSDYIWAHPDQAPDPLHPAISPTSLATLPQPQRFEDPPSPPPGSAEAALEPVKDDTRAVKVALKMPDTANKLAPNHVKKGGEALDQNVKLTHEEVNYGAGKDLEKCANCRFFEGPDDCELVMQPIVGDGWCKKFKIDGLAEDHWAFDRGSARTYDMENRLHVSPTNISKANICPYLGKEIPDWRRLGLQPDKIYKLYRDPNELAKAAPSFNNLPVLSKHVAVTAADHQPDLVVGSTGTDSEFKYPYLQNSIVIWAKDAIDDVESESKKELSSAYRYRADMTPGEVEGTAYDGVMRDIVGNHVALVKEGRAGSDVVVGDSKENLTTTEILMDKRLATMARGALIGFLGPKLAQDAQIDLGPALNVKTFDVATVSAAVRKQVEGKLAKDAKLEGLDEMLKYLAMDEPPPFEGKPEVGKGPGKDAIPPQFVKEKKDDDKDDEKKGEDEEDPNLKKKESGNPAAGEDEEDDETKEKKEEEAEKAMDAKISTAVTAATRAEAKRQADIREAERFVRPWVGETELTFDSAEAVHRNALKMLGADKDTKDVHPSALPHLIKTFPKPGSRKPGSAQTVVMDSSLGSGDVQGFTESFPGANRIQVI